MLRTHSCDTEVQVTLPYSTWSVTTIALRLMLQVAIIYTRVGLRYFSLYCDWADFQLNYSQCQEFTQYIVQPYWCVFTQLLCVYSWIRLFTDTNWITPCKNCVYFLHMRLFYGCTSVSGNRFWKFCSQRQYFSATSTTEVLNTLIIRYIIVSIDILCDIIIKRFRRFQAIDLRHF